MTTIETVDIATIMVGGATMKDAACPEATAGAITTIATEFRRVGKPTLLFGRACFVQPCDRAIKLCSISDLASGESHFAGPAIVAISQPSAPISTVVGKPSLPSSRRMSALVSE